MAADDPYDTLGVARTASVEDIRKAFRALAKKHHPDLNPGDKAAEARFKAITAAHELLSDIQLRARFDRGEIDAAGQERARPPPPGRAGAERSFYRGFADAEAGARYRRAGGNGADANLSDDELGDILGAFFRRGSPDGDSPGAGGEPLQMRGHDQSFRLAVDFLDAVGGATRRLTLPGGRFLDVAIPPGLEDGQTLRLRGQGSPGLGGGPPGDALIEVSVGQHKLFRRQGRDIHLDLPVSLSEAVLGARVSVPTPGGPVTMTIPKRSDSGARLRLRGRGVPARGSEPAGDVYITLRVVVGPVDAALEAFLAGWAPDHPFDPRRDLPEASGTPGGGGS